MKVWLLIGTIDHEADLVFGVYADEGDADRECRRLEGLPYNERSYCNSFAVHEHEVIGAAERAATDRVIRAIAMWGCLAEAREWHL